jgi:hypothetical protein
MDNILRQIYVEWFQTHDWMELCVYNFREELAVNADIVTDKMCGGKHKLCHLCSSCFQTLEQESFPYFSSIPSLRIPYALLTHGEDHIRNSKRFLNLKWTHRKHWNTFFNKNAVFLDMRMRRGSCKNRSFGETYRLHLQGENTRVPLLCSQDVHYDGRRRGLLAEISQLTWLCVAVEMQLIGRSLVECDDQPDLREGTTNWGSVTI